MATVPRGALPRGGQVAFTNAHYGPIKKSLKGALRGDDVIFAVGFVMDHNGKALKAGYPSSSRLPTPNSSLVTLSSLIVAASSSRLVW